jgi:hypothetical protein
VIEIPGVVFVIDGNPELEEVVQKLGGNARAAADS